MERGSTDHCKDATLLSSSQGVLAHWGPRHTPKHTWYVLIHPGPPHGKKVFFGLFQSQPEIAINLNGGREHHRRILSASTAALQVPCAEECPVIRDNDHLAGKVVVRQKRGASIEHGGVAITLVGVIERRNESQPTEPFMSMRLQLAPAAESPITREIVQYDFDFGRVRLPYPSYDGEGISLRYQLRVVVHRKLSDNIRELTLWSPVEAYGEEDVTTAEAAAEAMEMGLGVDVGARMDVEVEAEGEGEGEVGEKEPKPIDLEVGLEEFLHIKLALDRSVYGLQDEIVGSLNFLLVRARVVEVDLSLMRKELSCGGEVISSTKILSKQIVLGAATRGDHLPVQLDLATVTSVLTPTFNDLGRTFSVKYFVGIFLRDMEGRKYYKQVEVQLQRRSSEPRALYRLLPEFKIGLAVA